MDKVVPGRYRHFKGKDYRVLFIAVHDETRERLVVYVPLYGEGKPTVRTEKNFLEHIDREDYHGPRFMLLEAL